VLERSAVAPGGEATRAYSGQIVGGTGRYAGSRGTVSIRLGLARAATTSQHERQAQRQYDVSLGFHGAPCSESQRPGSAHTCLALSGTIAGSGVEEQATPRISDLPATIRIAAASGSISPLGPVVATGEVIGVGFVRAGRLRLNVTVAARSGTVVVRATGPLVPGFTHP
jgi:hypothetical protein